MVARDELHHGVGQRFRVVEPVCTTYMENLMTRIPKTYACGPGFGTRGKRAYEMRLEGKMWAEVAVVMQPPSSTSDDPKANPESAVTNAARKYALSRELPWPVKLAKPPAEASPPPLQEVRTTQKRAYDLRAEGKSWSDVVAETGYSSPSHAISGAKRHALREGLTWPVST